MLKPVLLLLLQKELTGVLLPPLQMICANKTQFRLHTGLVGSITSLRLPNNADWHHLCLVYSLWDYQMPGEMLNASDHLSVF